jgi:branched-chain amino acid transport system ATP-binding protein
MSLLTAQHIGVQFGGVKAVHDVSLTLERGQILGLIGPNGAGKTTLFNALTGFVPKSSGTVMLENRNITNSAPFDLPKLGVARTFQVERPFEDLTVLENVMMSSFLHHHNPKLAKQHATQTLEQVGLLDRANQKCSELNLARRRRLEIGKALALKPKVLFLDEVIAGLNPPAQSEMIGFVKNLASTGIGIVMVEHIMRVIMTLSDHVICMAFGEKIAEGTPTQISSNPVVIDAYLGGGEDD